MRFTLKFSDAGGTDARKICPSLQSSELDMMQGFFFLSFFLFLFFSFLFFSFLSFFFFFFVCQIFLLCAFWFSHESWLYVNTALSGFHHLHNFFLCQNFLFCAFRFSHKSWHSYVSLFRVFENRTSWIRVSI